MYDPKDKPRLEELETFWRTLDLEEKRAEASGDARIIELMKEVRLQGWLLDGAWHHYLRQQLPE